MKHIELKLKDINDPFSQGFCSFFIQNFAIFHNLILEDYGGKNGLVRGEKIVISDHERCDIGLMNVDTDSFPPNAKIVFCNAKENYRANEHYFPYLQNARNESILMDGFENNAKYEKKYNCVAVFNSHTNDIRKSIKNKLMDVCDVVVVDGAVIKGEEDTNDHWTLMKNSRFCICPPGHVDETYRFYEALKCHCIPIEMNKKCKRAFGFSEKYIVGEFELDKIKSLKYSEEDISEVRKNVDREFLLNYLVKSISSYNIG